jgi:hypothetical protein
MVLVFYFNCYHGGDHRVEEKDFLLATRFTLVCHRASILLKEMQSKDHLGDIFRKKITMWRSVDALRGKGLFRKNI